MLILIDIHCNILSVQGFLKCSSDCISNVDISIEPSNFILSFCKNSSFQHLNVVIPEKLFLPSTISSVSCKSSPGYVLKHEENMAKLNFPIVVSNSKLPSNKSQTLEIRFRLQISNGSLLKNYVPNVSNLDFKNFMHAKLMQNSMFHIVCTDCGTLITENNISFHSVHKYYEGISELAENWFCHKHGDHNSPEMNVDSLYIGDMYFYFHSSILKSFMLSESIKEYKCKKCSSILSLKKKMDNPFYIGFFCDKIMFVESDAGSHDIKNYKFNSALVSLCSVIKELLKSGISGKIYLQCKVAEVTEVLLLWINSQEVVQFFLHIEDDDEIPRETDFNAKEVYKVLYCSCTSDSELSKKWKHDFCVEFFQISDNMMKAVRNLLQQSSNYFPDDQETIKGFSFGYLPAYFSMT